MIKTLRIYSLSNFQMYHIVALYCSHVGNALKRCLGNKTDNGDGVARQSLLLQKGARQSKVWEQVHRAEVPSVVPETQVSSGSS